MEVDEPADGVARLTISNPAKRNALDRAILDGLASVLPAARRALHRADRRGPVFSAGYDIGDLAPERLAEEAAELVAHPFEAALEALDAVAVPGRRRARRPRVRRRARARAGVRPAGVRAGGPAGDAAGAARGSSTRTPGCGASSMRSAPPARASCS